MKIGDLCAERSECSERLLLRGVELIPPQAFWTRGGNFHLPYEIMVFRD